MPRDGRPHSGGRGRSSRVAGVVAAGLLLAVAGPAVPAPAEQPDAPAPLCRITDPRLAEVSGLVAVTDGVLVMNDGGEELAVHLLNDACQVVDVHTAPIDPYDPEDMAVTADGTIWLADTGDNDATRSTVALHVIRPDGTTGLFRLAYPDGPHDAEALLVPPDGTPYVVTKEVLGASGVYSPASPLVDGGTVPLARVAGVNMTLTGTAGGPVGRAGQLLVTGGAVSADGRHLALRTYTDAYVWPLVGSDVVGALAGDPVTIPLPASPQGEAIGFATDGASLLVASEGLPSDLTRVSLDAGVVAAAPPAAEGTVPSFPDRTWSGLSPWVPALGVAAVAIVLLWIGSKLRRRP